MEATRREGIQLRGEQATSRTNAWYARSPSKGGLNGQPNGMAGGRSRRCGDGLLARRSRLLRVRCLLAESLAASDEGIPRDEGLLRVHRASPAPFARSGHRTSRQLKVGSKIFYFQVAGQDRAGQRHRHSTWGPAPSQPAIASFVSRPGSDCARSRTARERSPGSRPCTCHGRFVDPEALALGRDVQLQPELEPVGERPVTERVRPVAFVSLGEVHRRIRAAGRRSGDLYERLPALLVLPGQQARVDSAAAGEGEVGRGHDRPVLRRPDQADEGYPGRFLSFTALGSVLQPLLARSRDRCVLRRQYRAENARKRRRRAHPGQGELPTRSLGEAGERGGGLLRSRARATALLPTPEHGRWRSWSQNRPDPSALQPEDTLQETESFGETTRSRGDSGPCQADAARDVRIRLRGRRQRRTRSPTRTRRLHDIVPWLFLR